MLRRTTTFAVAIGLQLASVSISRATIVPFDISSGFNYDLVGTGNETGANSGQLAFSGLGDHNITRAASWGTALSYTNAGSAGGGTALPDDGVLGNYQLGPYDNGADYLTKSNNAIALRTHISGDGAIITRNVTLSPGQQGQYSSINLAFVNAKRDHGSTSYRTWIEVAYTDSSSEIVLDTGTTGSSGGTLDGGGLNGQGGLGNLTDNTSFVNQAPNNNDTFSPQLLLGMDHRLNGGSIGTGVAALWELDTWIPVDSTKVLESFTIGFRGPTSGANRPQNLYVLAVSGVAIPEPASVVLVGLGGLMLLGRRRR